MGAPKFGDARDVARTLEDYKKGPWSVGRILSISDDSTLGSYPPLRFNFCRCNHQGTGPISTIKVFIKTLRPTVSNRALP